MGFFNQISMAEKLEQSTSSPSPHSPASNQTSIDQQVSWAPLCRGGSNFKTAKLVQQGRRLMVKKSITGLLFALVFFIPGVLVLGVGTPYLFFNGEPIAASLLIVWGAAFAGAGWFLLGVNRRLVIDLEQGIYYRGKWHANREDYRKQGQLKDVSALQVLTELVTSTSEGRTSRYYSYELNLVLNNAQRVNIMDLGNKEALNRDAYTVAKELGLPVLRQ